MRSILELVIHPCREFTFDAIPIVPRANRVFFPLVNSTRDMIVVTRDKIHTPKPRQILGMADIERGPLSKKAAILCVPKAAPLVEGNGDRYNIFLHPIKQATTLHKSCHEFVETLIAFFPDRNFIGGKNPFEGNWSFFDGSTYPWKERSPDWITRKVMEIVDDVKVDFAREDVPFKIESEIGGNVNNLVL